MENNVIEFPKKNPRIKTLESINDNIDIMKQYHIQKTISILVPMIINQLELAGFVSDIDSEEDIKNGAFIVESLRSFMCKYYDIYHPFQQISNNVFHPDDKEIGAFKIVDKLNLELKNSETN